MAAASGVRFGIHGVGVEVYCDHAEAAERIREHFSSYLEPSGAARPASGIKIYIREGTVLYPVPLHAERVLRFSTLRSYYLDGWTYFTDYFSTLTIDPEGRKVNGNLSPDTIKDFGVGFFVDLLVNLAVFEALRFHGLYYLHAAALEGPDGTGYLISGNAGSGKTSMTLNLIHAGFKFVSDDTVFLKLEGERDVTVLGFARDFHVPEDLIREKPAFNHLSALSEFTPYRNKRRLRPEEWFGGQRTGRLLNPRVLLFPRLGEAGESLTALSKTEGLTQLLPQSLAVMFHPGLAQPHLEALRRVLNHGRAFRLRSPQSIKGDPAASRQLVERARDLALKE